MRGGGAGRTVEMNNIFYFFTLLIIHYFSMMLLGTIHAGIFLQIIIPYYLIIGGLIFLLSTKVFHFRFCLFLLFNSIVFVCSCGLFFLMCKASEISYLLSDFLETFWIFIFRAEEDPLSILVIGILNIPAYYICSVISYTILHLIKRLKSYKL